MTADDGPFAPRDAVTPPPPPDARTPAAGSAAAGDRDEAFHLALLLAEEDARLGDYRQALHALDAAAALAGGVLPKEWSESRARWQRELTPQRP